ncbi:GNAT superfamily N-acetyltransferase [Kitasatospora sp. MAA4]|uniref:GNAT family N-acetyltransferase n=1 Tax=Kitasatospora sp. MAA4 TaxID=3035093 RepID=UPI002474A668|nr:GNAT family N-acetyltransferase [Kitasatospora sp. MAA4]MDH6131286.1 GNAT superfamily N-acetyltransferase [Kitasatospora sp. MAA4]
MTWTLSDSAAECSAAAGAVLAAYPARNTVLLTVLEQLGAGQEAGAARFGWWRAREGGAVRAGFALTGAGAVRLGRMPRAAAVELAGVLAGEGLRVVAGAAPAAEAFAGAWAEATGGTARTQQRMRLYQLGTLAPPTVGGGFRPAAAAERELLADWYTESDEEEGEEQVDLGIAAGTLHVWEDGGRPTAMVATSSMAAGMAWIASVFTPPQLRGRGYGSAVTAAASAAALAGGAAGVLLFTDPANATSNSIYRKIGYRPVEDQVVLSLSAILRQTESTQLVALRPK